MTRGLAFGFCATILLASCARGPDPAEDVSPRPSPSPPRSAPWFEVARDAGVDFQHVRALVPRHLFPEIMSGGGGWLDYDGDGDLDLYLVQGGDLEPGHRAVPTNRLFRNDGGRFVDVTKRSGAADAGYGMGLAVSDFDGDGDIDLFVTNVGADRLYRNRGDGVFELREGAGVEDPGWSTSAAAFDYDLDGDDDLWVTHYVRWSIASEVACYGVGGARDYCHPNRYRAPAADHLYRNDGDLRFTDVSMRTGVASTPGNGLGVTILDADGDRRPDVYVANDGMPNRLWIGRGDGTFVDQASLGGCAVNVSGAAEAGMGIALGDADGDGSLDLLVTHLDRETNTLYRTEDGLCQDVTSTAGLAAPSLARTGFGTGFVDFDQDGMLDLWVTNGRVTLPDLRDEDDPYAEPDQVFRGLGEGRFALRGADEGAVGGLAENGRAAAFADYDGDGDVDVAVVQNGGPVRLFRNVAATGSWIQVETRNAGGAVVTGAMASITAAGVTHRIPLQRASSYCASNDPRGHAGLGPAERVEELTILPPGRGGRRFRRLPARHVVVVPTVDRTVE